ncbi:MAG: phosphomannomutase/phosphoglucomutase [Actinobacteria bacterium]|nr:phosphomannomutase/phosphoglucomutase [Actinomycetota bacterium]MCL6104397.1 phosphomannomutase/phosphoglucomutase [Actinomycetota bacterium]
MRGTVDSQLDDVTAWAIGRAFARFIGARDKGASQSSRPKILMARDMRSSGVWLSRAFAGGAMLEGVKVIDMGLSSTDMMYFASGKLNVGGAMFTASHNPAAYNGIKLCLSGARPVGEDSGLAQIKQFAKEVAPQTSNLHVPEESQLEHVYLLEAFADHVRSFVDISALKPLKVVADVANGMGGLVVPKIFEKLPFQLSILYPELDGTFPNHPADPIQPENLVDLKKAVLEDKADIGLAFDGDADRVFLVDEKAQPISGSTTTALVAKAMLEKHPGSTILYNLICSKVVPETIEHYGGTAIRTRVGHSFIKAVMAKTSAVFGGEHSGHYYFRDNYRADSGLIAALIVLEVLSNAQVPLSELCKPFQKYAASGEINTKVPDPQAVIERVAAYFQKIPTAKLGFTDGLTVELENWWFNLRPSNTEPLLRLNLEAADEQMCKSKTEEIRSLLR